MSWFAYSTHLELIARKRVLDVFLLYPTLIFSILFGQREINRIYTTPSSSLRDNIYYSSYTYSPVQSKKLQSSYSFHSTLFHPIHLVHWPFAHIHVEEKTVPQGGIRVTHTYRENRKENKNRSEQLPRRDGGIQKVIDIPLPPENVSKLSYIHIQQPY
jgi:hypothetical protein